ncbi:uncharacterized protein G2W53_045231 [Senna tora]|uniref:Uncharacterized protein n=1 Tax=Senna tora TaxID=362788 RepID=A0A834VWS3_9FABA|nr:uncharacterized protein G2W53_045231 [Senna tora]
MLQLESSWYGRIVHHVLTYPGQVIAVGSQKPSRITWQKACCANEKSRSDLSDLHELRAKRLVAQVSETRRFALYLQTGVHFMFQLESSWHRRSVAHVLTYSGREIALDVINLHELRGKRLVAQVRGTRRFALYLRSRVDLMLQLESSWHGRSADHVLTYTGREIAFGSEKASRVTRQKSCCRIVLAWEERGSCVNIFRMINRGRPPETFTNYEAKALLYKAWKERGSCLTILRMTNRGRISETFTNYEAKDLLRESNTSVRVVSANWSGFDAPIGVILAWEERGSCVKHKREILLGS